MIRFARFNNDGSRVALNPRNVTTVLANGSTCKVFTVEDVEPMTISGSFDEVVAALESVTAPPVAAAVGVAPTDLERASGVLDLLAMACEHYTWDDLDINTIDRAIGVNSPELHDTRDALRALAAKLRGGG